MSLKKPVNVDVNSLVPVDPRETFRRSESTLTRFHTIYQGNRTSTGPTAVVTATSRHTVIGPRPIRSHEPTDSRANGEPRHARSSTSRALAHSNRLHHERVSSTRGPLPSVFETSLTLWRRTVRPLGSHSCSARGHSGGRESANNSSSRNSRDRKSGTAPGNRRWASSRLRG